MNILKKIKKRKFNIDYHLEEEVGAGVSISPIAFLVVQANNVKLLPVNHSSAIDRLLDYMPDLIEKTNSLLNKQMNNKKEEKKEEERKIERQRREEKEERKEKEKKIHEDNATIVLPNTTKFHPKRNKPINYEIKYDENTDNNFEDKNNFYD